MFTILAVIYVVFISLGLPDSVFGASWPVIHLDFGLPESYASVYSIVTGICSGASGFVAGKLLRKFGTPIVTLVSIVMTAIGLLGMSFSPNIWVMMLFAVILGYGAGAIDTGLNNYVSLHYKASHMSWLHCFWGVGVTASPLIVSPFLAEGGSSWRKGYQIIALLQIIIALITLLALKKWRKEDTKADTAKEDENSNDKPNYLHTKGFIASVLSLGCYTSMEFLLGTWGATYFVNINGADPSLAAKWVSFYFGGITIGRLISGFISIKVNDNNMIRGGAVFSTVGMILLLLPFSFSPYVGFLLIGIGFGPIFPCVIHSVPFRFGAKFSADYTGVHMGTAYGIGYVFSLIFGFIAAKTSFFMTPIVLLCLAALVLMWNEIAIKKTKVVKISTLHKK